MEFIEFVLSFSTKEESKKVIAEFDGQNPLYVLFPTALQHFADKICEQQRENCAEMYRQYCGNDYEPSTYEAIRASKQPEINDLKVN